MDNKSVRCHQHVFPNGLVLLAEPFTHVRSAAFNFLVPCGTGYDPTSNLGLANVLSEMLTRGAGERDSRAMTLALDSLGLDRDESVGIYHLRFWGSTLGRNVLPSLELYADVLRNPLLPEDELPAAQALAIQDIESLEDDPKQKTIIEIKKKHFPSPFGHDRRGTPEGIESLTPELIRSHWQRHFHPNGTILSVAGELDWDKLLKKVDALFGNWEKQPEAKFEVGVAERGIHHLHKETQQTQIGLAFDSVPYADPNYYSAMGAVNVLSGGMSSRLFTEVREKRGLCYAVWASMLAMKDRGAIVCYAGSTNERAQETLDVTLKELRRIEEGIEPDEVARLQAGLKSSLIMQEESTSARAGAIASDWFYLNRIRPVEEIQAAIDALSPESITKYCQTHPMIDGTRITLGPKALV